MEFSIRWLGFTVFACDTGAKGERLGGLGFQGDEDWLGLNERKGWLWVLGDWEGDGESGMGLNRGRWVDLGLVGRYS